MFAHWVKQPVEETSPRDIPVTTENEAGIQAEELAIDDAFAIVEADQLASSEPSGEPSSEEEKKQEI